MLPDSQLDRFMIRLNVGYPAEADEIRMLKDRRESNPLATVRPVMTAGTLQKLRALVDRIHVDDKIYAYVTELVNATRHHDMLALGISPRGSLAVLAMAKANAMLNRRDYVIPEDIAGVFSVTCAHRMILTPVARMNRVTSEDVAEQVLASVIAPKIFA